MFSDQDTIVLDSGSTIVDQTRVDQTNATKFMKRIFSQCEKNYRNSGAIALLESMPPFFQYLSLLNPLRHYIVIVRGFLLKGVGINVL